MQVKVLEPARGVRDLTYMMKGLPVCRRTTPALLNTRGTSSSRISTSGNTTYTDINIPTHIKSVTWPFGCEKGGRRELSDKVALGVGLGFGILLSS